MKIPNSQFDSASFFLDWATSWREEIAENLQGTNKEELDVDVYSLQACCQFSSQDVDDDACLAESGGDCGDELGTLETSITKQTKEQTQRCFSRYIIYAGMLKKEAGKNVTKRDFAGSLHETFIRHEDYSAKRHIYKILKMKCLKHTGANIECTLQNVMKIHIN